MSERLWHLLSGKLDEIAAFYKVRPRITLIVRVPGRPKEGVFLSDDNWTDAVATVRYLSGDGGTFAAGSPEPPAECPAPPARDEVREAAEAFRKVNSAQRDDSCTDAGCIVCKRREAGERLLAALAARKRGTP